MNFLTKQAKDLGLDASVVYPVNKENPLVLIKWQGSEPKSPSILLNSHMDVVPVAEEYWSYPPFGAKIDENGNIYARGAQDMKSVGMLYLAAIRALKRKGITQLKRTVYLTYVPDEEVGGQLGLDPFVKTEDFRKMNVGFALDEGFPSATDLLEVYNTEKVGWQVSITAHGHSGHGSILFENTAGEKLNYIISKFMEMRKSEMIKWKKLKYPYGNVTSINLTILGGGIKANIVPPAMNAFFDVRLGINVDWDEFDRTVIVKMDRIFADSFSMNFIIRLKVGSKKRAKIFQLQ